MTNLTERWKKGELPSGFYYIRRGLSKRIDMSYLGGAFFEGNIEVILPVPSYEEYQQLLSDQLAKNEGVEINAELENRINLERELYKKVLEETAKLKGLLGRCRELLSDRKMYGVNTSKTWNIITLIDQVLGE